MTELTLVSHNLCPYVQRAAIALDEKGVTFERVTVDLARKPEWFLAMSPLGKVPLLRVSSPDGSEAVIFESNVICEYIEESQVGPKLHPSDPLQRAEHRSWIEFGSSILGDVWHLETTQDANKFETTRAAIAAKFSRVEAALRTEPWFGGEHFSLVDVTFAPILRYFDVFERIANLGVFAGMPKVERWRVALRERPSVITAVGVDYQDLLLDFILRHDAHLLKVGV